MIPDTRFTGYESWDSVDDKACLKGKHIIEVWIGNGTKPSVTPAKAGVQKTHKSK
jgi:hypothetical protein